VVRGGVGVWDRGSVRRGSVRRRNGVGRGRGVWEGRGAMQKKERRSTGSC